MAAARKELLDRLYQRLSTALDQLLRAIGLKSSPHNENKVLVEAPITVYVNGMLGQKQRSAEVFYRSLLNDRSPGRRLVATAPWFPRRGRPCGAS